VHSLFTNVIWVQSLVLFVVSYSGFPYSNDALMPSFKPMSEMYIS